MADKKKKAQSTKRKRVEKKEKEPERRSTRQSKAPSRFAEGDEEETLSTRQKAAKEVREKAAKKAKVEKAKKKKEAEEKKKKEEEEEEEVEEDDEEEVETKKQEKKQPQSKPDPKKKAKPAEKEEDEEEDDGEEKDQKAEEDKDEEADEDDEEEDDRDEEAFAEHQKTAPKHAKKALQNFKKEMEVFKWKSSKKKNYILLIKKWPHGHRGEELFEGDDWPRAFVGNEGQPITAALYEINDKGTASILISIWTVSVSADESSQFYLGPAQDAAWEFAESIDKDEGKAFLGDKFELCRDSLSVSSGDYKVKQFYCPALESLNALECVKK